MCYGFFKWVSIICVPITMVSFAILFPLSLMASGGIMFWALFWTPFATISILSFVRAMTHYLDEHKVWIGLHPWGTFAGWSGIGLVGLYILGLILRIFGGLVIDTLLEYLDIFMLGVTLLCTLFLHASVMRLFAFSKRAATYWIFWSVLACHTYAIFFIFQVLGFADATGFSSTSVSLWLFVEAVIFSLGGTIGLFVYNNAPKARLKR